MNVTIADYAPEWPLLFEKERQLLAAAIAPSPNIIAHIGSTSVPGLAAKPVIDIMIGLHDFSEADAIVPAIEALGYEYVPRYEDVMPYRRYFRKRDGETATHHIHMVAVGGEFWDRHILFRDFLRDNREALDAYAALKRDLAEREWTDGNEYAGAKTEFITGMEERARVEREKHGRVTSVEQLEAIYGTPLVRSLKKEIDYVSDHYRAFIERSPFVVLGTSGPEGLDCSPRGDAPGFVRVADPKTLLIPDRRGNNRLDSLRNIVRDGRVALLFLIPGIGETLRVNGRAEVITNPELCESFAVDGKAPKSVLVVAVETVYFQCQKALMRSGLWKDETRADRSELPSTGTILQALCGTDFDGAEYDRSYPERMKETIY